MDIKEIFLGDTIDIYGKLYKIQEISVDWTEVTLIGETPESIRRRQLESDGALLLQELISKAKLEGSDGH